MISPQVLVLAGPTAAGKSAAALWVAEQYGATIVSADAMQVYRRFDIGTAKATAQERARVPHVGIDVVEPDEPFDAADFVALADAAMATGRVVLAGGTHFYLRAFQRGLVETPPVDRALRAELEARTDLHQALAQVDPALAARLHPNDHLRLVRGLEVFLASGQRLSDLQVDHATEPDRVQVRGLWLDRDDLGDRIDRRVDAMMAAGYLDEVRALLASGVSRQAKPMLSLGYRHLCDHLLDALPLDEAVRRTARDTRHFARKQRTWLRNLGYPQVTGEAMDAVKAAAAQVWGPRPG